MHRRRILLADSDRAWLQEAKGFLEGKRYTVVPATNGKNAQLSLGKNRYFAVVLGMGLRNHNGIRVMNFINTHHPDLKVIAILDKEPENPEQGLRLLEKFKQYRIDHILAKSSGFEQLKKELDHLETGESMPIPPPTIDEDCPDEQEFACNDNQFSKISIEDFYAPKNVFFDVFIRVRNSRYIKVLRAGDRMSPERIDRYRNDKKTLWLYFKKNDLDKYVQFQNFLAGWITKFVSEKQDIKLGIFKNVTDKYLEQSFYEGINSKVLAQGKKIAQNIGELVKKEKTLIKHLAAFDVRNKEFASSSFLVTLFATAIVKKFNWKSPKTMETVAVACLFRDIGMLKLPEKLMDKNIHDMSPEELELYRTHPKLSAEMVGDSPLISHTIKQIICQHHEYYNGTGYPNKKRRQEILILANIVSLTDDFVRIIMERELLPYQALDIFFDEKNSSKRYHPAVVRHFLSLFAEAGHLLQKAP